MILKRVFASAFANASLHTKTIVLILTNYRSRSKVNFSSKNKYFSTDQILNKTQRRITSITLEITKFFQKVTIKALVKATRYDMY